MSVREDVCVDVYSVRYLSSYVVRRTDTCQRTLQCFTKRTQPCSFPTRLVVLDPDGFAGIEIGGHPSPRLLTLCCSMSTSSGSSPILHSVPKRLQRGAAQGLPRNRSTLARPGRGPEQSCMALLGPWVGLQVHEIGTWPSYWARSGGIVVGWLTWLAWPARFLLGRFQLLQLASYAHLVAGLNNNGRQP